MIHDLNKKFTFIKKRIIDLDQENTDSEDEFEVNFFYEPCSCFFDSINFLNSQVKIQLRLPSRISL